MSSNTARDASRQLKPGAVRGNKENRPASARGFGLFWLCMTVGLAVIAALVWLFGLTWWTALIGVVLIGCPVVMAWIMLGGLDRIPRTGR